MDKRRLQQCHPSLKNYINYFIKILEILQISRTNHSLERILLISKYKERNFVESMRSNQSHSKLLQSGGKQNRAQNQKELRQAQRQQP